jgi:hypothetical protein
MATTSILSTYGDASRKESVLSLVEILTAKENFFLNNLSKTKATDTIHSCFTDTQATAASAAVTEGGDYSYKALTTPSKVTNLVEIVAWPFRVSYVQSWSDKYTEQDEMVRQTTKALTDWGNAVEYDLVRSTLVSGASGTAPKMNGIMAGISASSNVTAHSSGTVFSASILKALMKDNWDDSNGELATDLFMGSYLKTIFDGFTAGSTKYIMAEQATVTDFVDIYDGGGFGRLRVHTHRYVQVSGDATGQILALRPEKLSIAYMKEPFIEDVSAAGPYQQKAIVGAMTLEVRNKTSNWMATGFNIG